MIKTAVLVDILPLCFCCAVRPVSWPACLFVSSRCIIKVGILRICWFVFAVIGPEASFFRSVAVLEQRRAGGATLCV